MYRVFEFLWRQNLTGQMVAGEGLVSFGRASIRVPVQTIDPVKVEVLPLEVRPTHDVPTTNPMDRCGTDVAQGQAV